MDRVSLGKTGILVSRLCFGTLTLSPLQRNLSVREGADLLIHAFDRGMNFLDTAELYDNYPAISLALKYNKDAVVCTKCYAYDRQGAKKSFENAIRSINRDYIDIFMLHDQESEHTLRGHAQALEYFFEMREKGYIRAVGISTHHVAAVNAAVKHGGLDVIHPIYNKAGIGILDGTAVDMLAAIEKCHASSIGVFSMKPLGGGHLSADGESSLRYVLGIDSIDSIAVGMQSMAEIDFNCALFNGEDISQYKHLVSSQKRSLMIHDWCEGCGRCASVCDQKALVIDNGKARVDNDKCVLCGYCGAACPQFCIKVV